MLPEATHGGPLSLFLASPGQGRPPSDGEARIAPAPYSKLIKGLQRDVAPPLLRHLRSDATGGMSGTDTRIPPGYEQMRHGCVLSEQEVSYRAMLAITSGTRRRRPRVTVNLCTGIHSSSSVAADNGRALTSIVAKLVLKAR
jgi:hypothetical protein